jgi:Plasmid pRiA4b ORF-3-like protein
MDIAARNAQHVISLKVTLRGIRPPIWRRLEVPSQISLGLLHDAIQAAMGWGGFHLYAFEISGRRYGDPTTVDDVADDMRLTLAGVIKSGVRRFFYTYDFGDDWEHEIVIEGKKAAIDGLRYPICIAGKMNCPPEDCGGVWGYRELLAALADPSSNKDDEWSQWMERAFDPKEFSIDIVNARIGARLKSQPAVKFNASAQRSG